MFYKNKQKGFSLLEVVIGLAVVSFVLSSLFSVSQISLKIINNDTRNIKAAFLMEEGVETAKILRDFGWNANIKYASSTAPVYIDGFERKIIFEDVYRNGNDDISSSGILDSDTKKVTVYVAWPEETGTTTKNVSTYITNLFRN